MAAQLPDELIVEILSLLPAKSLLRCQLVCKSWLSLINSTKFKLMHLHNFNQLNPRYFVRRVAYHEGKEWFWVHFDDETFTEDYDTEIEFPFYVSRVNYGFRIIGCCNGVVCLSDDEEYESISDAIILWNPSIRRKLTLPMFSPIDLEDSFVVLGFGYDKMSDDYKVVSLAYVDCSFRPKVEVYSVKTGIWREVMFPDNLSCFSIRPNRSQVFSNGCVHWIACDRTPGVSHCSIMTFDINTELFGEIEFPELLAKKFLVISEVGESLAVIYFSNLNRPRLESGITDMVIVMVMKEYKNPTSWTLLYCMDYPDIDIGKPLRLRDNWDMIVQLESGVMVNFNYNESYYLFVFDDCEEDDYDNMTTYVDRYQESLALLDVGDSVPNEEAMKALMIIENQGIRQ